MCGCKFYYYYYYYYYCYLYCYKRYFEEDIFNFDFNKIGNDFQAIYMDPPLLLPGEQESPGKITIQQFVIENNN